MMKRKILIIVSISTSLFLMLMSAAATFAWFFSQRSIDVEQSGGSVLTQYFHSGTGTEEDPYVITRPLHYCNLVMLYAANPEFNESDFIDNSLFFRIGSKDLDNDGTDELTEYSVFNYLDNGTTDNSPSDTLNMASYSNGLYPIGSAEKPFQAQFDGSGLTVKNLTVIGSSTVNNTEYKTPDIGIFGYVSQDANIHNIYVRDFTIDLSGVDGSATFQTSTTEKAHIEHENKAYVGYIAGHIITGAQVNNVYVNDCRIIGGNAAECGFGYFGHVEDENGIEVITLGSEIATQRIKGDEAGFGGSLDMKTMLTRLQQVWTNSAAFVPSTYNDVENIVIDENYNTWKSTSEGSVAFSPLTVTSGSTTITYSYKYYASEYAGKYYYFQRDDMANHQFMCMYGEIARTPKTVNTYTVTSNDIGALYIKNGSDYLTATSSSSLSAVTVQADASKWIFDQSGHLYTYIDHNSLYDVYYLVRDGLSRVGLSQTADSVWNLDAEDGSLYTSVGGYDYYLDYSDNAWLISSVKEYYSISDGQGHYLSCNNTPAVISVGTEAESVRWQMKTAGNTVTFYTVINDTVYYLVCDGTLTLSETESGWDSDNGKYKKTIDNREFVLVYTGSNWSVSTTGSVISENSHYLSANSSAVIDRISEADATIWQFNGANGSYEIFTYFNSIKYFLSYSTNGDLSVSQVSYLWQKDNNSYYKSIDGQDFYIRYSTDGGWVAVPNSYRVIYDGSGNYLRMNNDNTFGNTTSLADATKFYFSNGSSGTASYKINSITYHLGVTDGSFANVASTWTLANNKMQVAGTHYFLSFTDNVWKIVGDNYYTINSNGNYLNLTAENSFGTDKWAGSINDTNGNTAWTFSNTTGPAGTISTKKDNTTYYLNGNYTAASGCGGTAKYEISVSTSNTTTWTNNSNKLDGSNVRINYNSGWSAVSTSSNGTTLTFTKLYDPSDVTILEESYVTTPDTTTDGNTIPDTNTEISNPTTVSYGLNNETTTDKTVVKETQTGVNGGYQTYFPLRVADDTETDWYNPNDPFRVSRKNTGYIISGARVEDSLVLDDFQKAAGDIRISYFPISSISGSYANNAFTNIYTIDDSAQSNHVLDSSFNSPVYESAKEQLRLSLEGSSSVYGLHFMDAEISMNHLLKADKAVILNTEYENYEMPLDSIDFRVVERGTISFFAGEYFTNNNSFFSLHQIFRDENQKITAIKEILEIYQNPTYTSNRPYIYKFNDNTYTNADGSYTGATTLDAAYSTTPLFRTTWITNPTGMTSAGNKIYYFEIPVNKGEFCLGSVPGKTGAYLIYLDIATNGGEAISTIISSEGNGVTNSFKTEYRYSPDVLGDDYYSILLFSITAPEGTTENSFSVEVSFTDDPGETDYLNGIYTIKVLNKSGQNLKLDVLLADDDRISTNAFLYAYRIIYSNDDRTDQNIETVLDSVYWQSMASFTIPSSGDASELGYQ